jgi:hypothetical protein
MHVVSEGSHVVSEGSHVVSEGSHVVSEGSRPDCFSAEQLTPGGQACFDSQV